MSITCVIGMHYTTTKVDKNNNNLVVNWFVVTQQTTQTQTTNINGTVLENLYGNAVKD